ncbi:MAG: insulinase family protein [Prevotellaceae bacterium]|nr:insulinase family protein [Prevotellaceae bacterium]
MKRIFFLAVVCIMSCAYCFADTYETVDGDPMKARIYTLDNGLKVYLSVNKDEPRIQTYIPVRVGGKNDPSETTGLSHYLEHLMFKGTQKYGTSDFSKEKPYLDKIENLYEVYRKTTDPQKRKDIYHVIDSLSYKSSTFAIANEYDKLMATIGANGTNAYTSEDVTCYTEDIPSNEIENWAKIQSDRFKNMVIRGFHTELEAVYEEYNISLTQDMRKVWEELSKVLFPNHPYGQQTVIGTQDHLKNPSIVNIKKHFNDWYRPNNTAICMCGDLDFDKTIAIIKKYFGDWQPNPNVQAQHDRLLNISVPKLTAPVKREIIGREADMVTLGWALPGQKDKDFDYIDIISSVLQNGKAGLIDVDLTQAQRVNEAASGVNGMTDFSEFIALGVPKEGQTLDEVKDLLLAEIDKLKKGDFDESLLESIINNEKLSLMRSLESNNACADRFVQSFVNQIPWKDEVEKLDRMSRITKADIVAFANKYLTDGYAVIYKHKGENTNEKKIDKPAISPIEMNRDKVSNFVTDIASAQVEPIQPVFVDYEKDMARKTFSNGDELLYKQNTTNGTFTLRFAINRGMKADKRLDDATTYISYVGTSTTPLAEIQKELYRLACNVSMTTSDATTYISVSGLAENMIPALKIAYEWITDAKSDRAVYDNMVADILKSRADTKLNQRSNFQRLTNYGRYGSLNSSTNIMSEEELRQTDPQTLLDLLRNMLDYQKTIFYYGPLSQAEIENLLASETSRYPLKATVEGDVFQPLTVTENEVYIAPYDAKNIYMMNFSNNGQTFDATLMPSIELYNEYFGGGMNGVVFQELREARGLAYSAAAYYTTPAYKNQTNSFYSYIISQNDKLPECLSTFDQIIETLPAQEGAFQIAKDALLKRIATSRTNRFSVLGSFVSSRRLGLDHDINRDIYEKVQGMTLADLVRFQQQNVKNRKYKYLILGDEKELDMNIVNKLGTVHRLTQQDIFGY